MDKSEQNIIPHHDNYWDMDILPTSSMFDLQLKQIWRYRDLVMLFVWREFVSLYKQTILGPLWFFIQPLLTTITFTIVFGNIAKIPTNSLPPILFYLAGTTAWNYFAEVLNSTSNTFTQNASIFGKVYFPRIVMPLSKVISSLIKFGVQFTLFVGFMIYFMMVDANIHPQWTLIVLWSPVLLFIMAGLGLGIGATISALTTKYRDLTFLVSFGVQLLMYGTPVVYPISEVPPQYQWIVYANPMSAVVETFRYIYLGAGTFSPINVLYSFLTMCVVLVVGVLVFNSVEKSFTDTV